jgi:hypothetical protein
MPQKSNALRGSKPVPATKSRADKHRFRLTAWGGFRGRNISDRFMFKNRFTLKFRFSES